ncbi:MAG: hypothetical protein Tsb0010_15790 [Parvularculaceae bacterium]
MPKRLEQIWSGFETRSGRPLTEFDTKSMPEIEHKPEPENALPPDFVNPSKAALGALKTILGDDRFNALDSGAALSKARRGAKGRKRKDRSETQTRSFAFDPPVTAPMLANGQYEGADLAIRHNAIDYVSTLTEERRRELEAAYENQDRGFFGRLFGRKR